MFDKRKLYVYIVIEGNEKMNNKKNMYYRGYVELLVLFLLQEEDSYGLELVKKIKQLSNDVISLSVGSLYPTLYRLIDKNLISDYKVNISERMVRVYYHIEQAGIERLKQLKNDFYEITNTIVKIIDDDTERR